MIEKLAYGYQRAGASPESIAACEAKLNIALPEEYKNFLTVSDGFNDEVGLGYLVLWGVAELAEADGYEIFEFQQNRFLIGSNGGPTAYAIVDGNYISLPFVFAGHWQDEAQVLGTNFNDFIMAIERGEGS